MAIATVPSPEIAVAGIKAVQLMPLAYAKDVLRMNKEIDVEVSGPKQHKPTSMEHLQAY